MAIIKGTNKDDVLVDTGSPTEGYDNTFLGLGGNDTIYVDQGNDTVDAGDGNDQIYARWTEDVRIHRQFDDVGPFVSTRGETYSDTIDAGAGNDLVALNAGHSVADGGAGYDLVTLESVSGQVFFSFGNIRVQFDATYDRSAKAIIDIGRGIVAYSGFDMSVDVFYYERPGDLSSRVDVGSFSESHIGSMGHTISNFEGARGQAGRVDVLRGSDRTDVVEIFAPGKGMMPTDQTFNDVIEGRGGIDVVSYAGELGGVDVNLARGVAKGIKTVIGDRDFNTFRDKLIGVEGAFGGSRDDILRGSAKDNWFSGGGGADQFIGGKGTDIVTYTLGDFGNRTGTGAAGFPFATNGSLGIEVDLMSGTVRDDFGATDNLSGIEGIVGTAKADEMRGNTGRNLFWGGAGDDTLDGLAGNDVLQGGDGTDTIDGGAGFDTLDFSTGFPEGGRGVDVALKAGTAVDPFDTTDSVTGIEKVIGTALRDLIKGDNRANVLIGGDGRDNLGGLGGKDQLYGGDDKDSLGGGDGDDQLSGGNGDDMMFGGLDNDKLYGGADDDRMFGEEGDDILKGGTGQDELKDDKMTLDTLTLFNRAIDLALQNGSLAGLATKQINQLYGEADNDKLLGVGILDGGAGNDEIRGGGVLIGGAGNDRIFADPTFTGTFGAIAFVIGGLGNDTITRLGDKAVQVSYQYSANAISVDMAAGTVNAGPGDHDTLVDVFGVLGTAKNDLFKDDAASHSYHGGNGNDRFFIDASTDFAIGEGGQDRFVTTGTGYAELNGGADNDTFIIKSGAVNAGGGVGTDTFTLFGQARPAGHFDATQYILDGGRDADVFVLNMFGASSTTSINAGQGNDSIQIKGGNSSPTGANVIDIKLGAGRDTVTLSGGHFLVDIADFRPGEDRLGLVGAMPQGVNSFSEIVARAHDLGNDVIIDLADGTIQLADLNVSDLTAGMFIF